MLGSGVSSIGLLCAPRVCIPISGTFLCLLFFTSRCLTRDLPTFRVRQAYKNPGGFSGKDLGPAPSSRERQEAM